MNPISSRVLALSLLAAACGTPTISEQQFIIDQLKHYITG